MRVVIAAGGTGGHTIPANRLAKQLNDRGVQTTFFATKGFGTQKRALFIDPFIAFFRFIYKRPNLVIGFGSYHSFPALIAATLLRIPIVLVELNALPGRVNRFFARFAKWTAANIPFEGGEHAKMPLPEIGNQKRERLLIMGGSQGAQSLDEEAAKLKTALPITHLTKANFVEDMAPIWESADIAITRAGGMTIAELLHYQVPAILVPYPHATDDHQTKNALYLEKLGVAKLFSGDLQKDLCELLEKKETMRKKITSAPPLVHLIMAELFPSTHLLGIGGCGMLPLAHILLDRNIPVSGNDVKPISLPGVRISKEHSAKRVVRSTAIPLDHPELTKPYIHRSELLAEQMVGKKGLLVTGTHGKTSTSALLAWTLHSAGLDPAYAVGGVMRNFGKGGGYGTGEYFVAEADESDGSFLNLKPHHAIITNVEPEHLDYWKTRKAMEEGFLKFIGSIEKTLVWCADDPFLAKLNPSGISYSCKGTFSEQNAKAVATLAKHIGISDAEIAHALATFKGVKRRLEHIGTAKNIAIYDDYAHHPTEIVATLATLSCPGRIIAVFQPHRYTRTRDHLDAFAKAFEKADEIIITDIYSAGEKPIQQLHALTLLEMLHGKRAHYIPRFELTSFLTKFVRENDLVLTMGAGDITNVGPELLDALT